MVYADDEGASKRSEGECFADCVGEMAEASHRTASKTELFSSFAAVVDRAVTPDLVQILEYVAEERVFVLRAGRGFPDDFYGRACVPDGLLSQAGRALLDPVGNPVKLEDFSDSREWSDDKLVAARGARSGIVYRVTAGGRSLGTLGVFYRQPRAFLPDEEGFLAHASVLLGIGAERIENAEEAIAWRSRAELLRSGAALLKVPAEKDELFSAAGAAAVGGSARPIADWCFTDSLEDKRGSPRLRRVAVESAEGASEHLEEAFSAPLSPNAPHGSPKAYATRQTELVRRVDPAFITDIAKDARHRRAVEEARPYSYACAPVIGAGGFHGAITFLRTETGICVPFDEHDRESISEFAALIAYAIERGMGETREIEETAEPDLPNLQLHLTDREYDVLEGIAYGERLAQLGGRLSISTNTVRTHKRHLCQKLGLSPSSSNSEIVAEARRLGLLTQTAIHAERRR